MTEQEVSVKVITEVRRDAGSFRITCFSDITPWGDTNPSIFKSQVPQERMTIDNVNVKEGELALSYKGGSGGQLEEGDLIISPAENDDPNNYSIQEDRLIYER